ncbi:MAG TPA: hypothetical protein VNZ22_12455, partial [Bacillota bacterium]|nr:hypothetical protein [Bacillota bacterium]
YRVAAGLVGAAKRSCPGCGRPLERRRRYCDVCAVVRHRANQRIWARKHRGELSKVKAAGALEHQGLAEAV